MNRTPSLVAFSAILVYLANGIHCLDKDAGTAASSKLQVQAEENPSRILMYMPLTSKSMSIAFLPLAEELAGRGHKVVVVMPREGKAKSNNLKIITIESEFEGKALKPVMPVVHNGGLVTFVSFTSTD